MLPVVAGRRPRGLGSTPAVRHRTRGRRYPADRRGDRRGHAHGREPAPWLPAALP